MAGTLYAGTSGYSYKEWRGAFFPEDLAQDRFLEYYSGQLPSVEINNTFYRFPTEPVLDQWAAETPAGFVFAAKGSRVVTHYRRLVDVGEVIGKQRDNLAALGDIGPSIVSLDLASPIETDTRSQSLADVFDIYEVSDIE